MFFQFRYVIFWKKDTGAQAACKMLVKLTTIVDFKKDETSRPCGNKYEFVKRQYKWSVANIFNMFRDTLVKDHNVTDVKKQKSSCCFEK